MFLYTAGKNTNPTDHGHNVHHPRHNIAIRDKCKQAGVECEMMLRDDDPSLAGDAANERMPSRKVLLQTPQGHALSCA